MFYVLLAFVVQMGAASLLLFAAAQKLAEPAAIQGAIAGLGVPGSPRVLAFLLVVAELATGTALVLAPGSLVTSAAVAALGLTFAAAGVGATLRSLRVRCACFGLAFSGKLGWRQVIVLPAWLAVAAIGISIDGPLLNNQRFQALLVLFVMLSIATVTRLAPLHREHRTLRRLMESR